MRMWSAGVVGWHARVVLAASLLAAVLVTAGCGTAPKKPKPAELKPKASALGAEQVWKVKAGEPAALASPLSVRGELLLTTASGDVVALDETNGQVRWRAKLGEPASSGLGSDGQTTAVVTQDNQLVALNKSKELWRVRLPAQTFTAPLVAGQRVFVLTADRTVSAFDGKTGARLWTQATPGEPLVLRQAGVMLAVGDTLVVGLSGRLTGLQPGDGDIRWVAPIANARGANEVERLVDLVGSVSRVDDSVCVRSYGTGVGCADTSRGTTVWSKTARGTTGVHGDASTVVGSESDGRVVAWRRDSGEVAWSVDRLKYRELGTPLVVGRVVAVGDSEGLVHLLSTEDGADLNRLTTDGSAIVGTPVLAGALLVVQTRKGGVFAWQTR